MLQRRRSTVGELQVDACIAGPALEGVSEDPVLLVVPGSVGGRQDLDGVAELFDGDGVAVGPPLPRVESRHGSPSVRESMSNGAELGGQVVMTDVGASLRDVGERGAVALDGWGGLLLGSCKGRGGPLDYPLGDVELTARLASAAPAAAGEPTPAAA